MSDKLDVESGAPVGPTKILNPEFCSILLANAVMNLSQYMTNALLPKYIDSMGMSPAMIGILTSAFAFTLLLCRFFAGPIMDTFNKKRIATIAIVGLAVAYAGFAISMSVRMIVVFRLLQGAVMAFGNACCLALAIDTIPKDKYSSGVGYFSLGMVVGQTLGPMAGLELVSRLEYKATYLVIACTSLVAAFLASRIKHKFTRTKKLKINFRNAIAKEALLPSLLLTLLYLVSTSITTFLIVYSEKQGVLQNIGLYFTVNAVVMVFTRPLMGKIADKYGFVKVFIPALFPGIAAFIIISYSNTLWMFLVASFLAAFGFGACTPLAVSQTMKGVALERQGAAISTNSIFMDLGAFAGSNFAGLLIQFFGYSVMWKMMCIPIVMAACLTFFTRGYFKQVDDKFI